MKIGTPHAIVAAGVMLAAAILIANRWEISSGSPALLWRVDKWSGNIERCYVDYGVGVKCGQTK